MVSRERGQGEKRKGLKESLFSLSGDSSAPKRKQKKGGKEEVLGGRKKKRGNE